MQAESIFMTTFLGMLIDTLTPLAFMWPRAFDFSARLTFSAQAEQCKTYRKFVRLRQAADRLLD